MSSELSPSARRPVEQRPVRVVSAHLSLRQRLAAIWGARELLAYLVSADVKIKYKGSFLGILWSMVSPAMSIGIYFLVFQVILKNDKNFLKSWENKKPTKVVFTLRKLTTSTWRYSKT